MKGRNS